MRLLPLALRPGDREVLEGWVRAGAVEARLGDRLDLLRQLFVTFLWDVMDQTPPELDLHCIVDNLAAHQSRKSQ
jgi:hypothetical protein